MVSDLGFDIALDTEDVGTCTLNQQKIIQEVRSKEICKD